MPEAKIEMVEGGETTKPVHRNPSPVRTILIIDHNEAARKALAFQLSEAYQMIETGTPEEALAFALRHKPDAILLDLAMPQCSGFEICQGLSTLSFTQLIPILVISSEPAEKFRGLCESLGASGYFQKPVNLIALQRRLTSLIERNLRERRSEPRVHLRVMLKLLGIDSLGAGFDLITVTENVSTHGFLCAFAPSVPEGSTVDVRLAREAGQSIGRARVIAMEWRGTPGQKCRFQFVDKPSTWVLS